MDEVEKNPPNTTFIGINNDDVEECIIEILSSNYDQVNKNIVFGFKIISGKLNKNTFSHVSLTIDSENASIFDIIGLAIRAPWDHHRS